MKKISALAFLSVAGLQACAAKPEPPPPIVDFLAMNCPPQISLTNAVPLAFEGGKEKVTVAVLDGNASCIQDATGGRALYQVFTLPRTDAPYIIAIRSLPWADTILAPKTTFLDQDGKPTRTSSHGDFTFRGQSLSSLSRSHADESYLVIESDAEVLGTEVSRIVGNVNQSMGATPYGTFYIYTGTDHTTHMTLTAVGRVETTLSPIPDTDKK